MNLPLPPQVLQEHLPIRGDLPHPLRHEGGLHAVGGARSTREHLLLYSGVALDYPLNIVVNVYHSDPWGGAGMNTEVSH